MKREENRIRRLQMAAQCVNKQISISEMALVSEVLCGYYSFFATCRLNGINPEEWLTFVLGHITDAKPSQ